MQRASWRGFLRLSLVSCPIYLSPATTRTKPIRLHQVWQPAPAAVDDDDLPDRSRGQQGSERSATRLRADSAAPDGEQSPAATRITLRPHDPGTGEEVEKREVVKGYEYSRGQFLTFTAEELKALDVESSWPSVSFYNRQIFGAVFRRRANHRFLSGGALGPSIQFRLCGRNL